VGDGHGDRRWLQEQWLQERAGCRRPPRLLHRVFWRRRQRRLPRVPAHPPSLRSLRPGRSCSLPAPAPGPAAAAVSGADRGSRGLALAAWRGAQPILPQIEDLAAPTRTWYLDQFGTARGAETARGRAAAAAAMHKGRSRGVAGITMDKAARKREKEELERQLEAGRALGATASRAPPARPWSHCSGPSGALAPPAGRDAGRARARWRGQGAWRPRGTRSTSPDGASRRPRRTSAGSRSRPATASASCGCWTRTSASQASRATAWSARRGSHPLVPNPAAVS